MNETTPSAETTVADLLLVALEQSISLVATGQTAVAIELLASVHWRIAHEAAQPDEVVTFDWPDTVPAETATAH